MWILKRLTNRVTLLKLILCVAILIIFFKIEKAISPEHVHKKMEIQLVQLDVGYIRKNVSQVGRNDSHANYSIPEVNILINDFLVRYKANNVLKLDLSEPYNVFLKRLNSKKPKGKKLPLETSNAINNSLERFYRGITQHYLYDPNDDATLDDLLKDLGTKPIVSSALCHMGSQMKIDLQFADGMRGRFRPMRKPKNYEPPLDTFFFFDEERPTSEIAGFHLDRVLGFNRAVPTVGRKLDMTRDLASFLANKTDVKFVYNSPGGNLCFVTKCLQFCSKKSPFCGHSDVIFGSVTAYLPPLDRTIDPYLYSHLYSTQEQAVWELKDTFCEDVFKKKHLLHEVLEFADMSVFDFLIGNSDRHSFEHFYDLGNESFVLIFDNGRGFGNSKKDCMTCLALLRQCCQIRLSTLAKLIKLYQGPDSLSRVINTSLNSDPLSPILTEAHLQALDRRVGKVIKAVSGCINNGRSWEDVVINDISPTV